MSFGISSFQVRAIVFHSHADLAGMGMTIKMAINPDGKLMLAHRFLIKTSHMTYISVCIILAYAFTSTPAVPVTLDDKTSSAAVSAAFFAASLQKVL